jgi:LuxR family maltose regulon positive regulatory protein
LGCVSGQSFLAQVFQAQGQLPRARAILNEALAEASKQGVSSRAYVARAYNSLACVLYEQNEIEAADRLISEAIEITRNWPNPNHMVYSFVLQARVQVALDHLEGARTTIEKAEQIRRNANLSARLHLTVEAEMIRVWLALQAAGASFVPGDPLAEQSSNLLASWKSELANLPTSHDPLLDECTETAAITLSRVSLASGRADEALTFLEPVTRKALAAGHITTAIRTLVLSAVAWQGKTARVAKGDNLSCLGFNELEKALNLAEPGGYARTFLDEGQPMQNLLANWLARVKDHPLRVYANHLLTQFGAAPLHTQQPAVFVEQYQFASISGPVDPGVRTANFGLVEPISQRKLEVLHLMALGKTNQEIASELVVATGTIKAHAASIYRKLDVANRTEAVTRARQLRILP